MSDGLVVGCPRCGQPAGSGCREFDGKRSPVVPTHWERDRAASRRDETDEIVTAVARVLSLIGPADQWAIVRAAMILLGLDLGGEVLDAICEAKRRGIVRVLPVWEIRARGLEWSGLDVFERV